MDLSVPIWARLSAPTFDPNQAMRANLARLLSSSPVITRRNPYTLSSSETIQDRQDTAPISLKLNFFDFKLNSTRYLFDSLS